MLASDLTHVIYFAEIYFIPIILTCYTANYFWNRRGWRLLFIIFAVVVFSADMLHYFSDKWYYKDYSLDKSSYIYQTQITKKIVDDAGGQPYDFQRVGLFA